jgi:hypothetical protein
MNEIYLCPDCRTEHTEPCQAVLGHIARCMGCALLLELLTEDQALGFELLEIRIAA